MNESHLTAVGRNVGVAAVAAPGAVWLFPRHAGWFWDYFDAFTVVVCFTVIGYYVEHLVLLLPDVGTAAGRLVRVTAWFAGGLWSYVVARFLWIRWGRDLADLPALIWGGVFLVALEVILHTGLKLAGRPSAFDRG